MPEAISFESRCHGWPFEHSVVAVFGFCRGNVTNGLQQSAMVEPVDPFQGGELDGFERAPGPTPVDYLGLVEAVDGLGQGVVVAVADAADGRLDPGFGQALGVFDRDVLAASITMMNKPSTMQRPPVMQSLLESIEHKAGMCRSRNTPANDAPGEGIDDKGDVDEARPGRDIGEVRDPQRVRPRCLELPVHAVQRARRRLVADRGSDRLATDNALQTQGLHQAPNRAAGNFLAFASQLPPNPSHAIDLEVLLG